jgi:hypothetical protein
MVFLAIFGCWSSPLRAATTFSNGSLKGRWAVEVGPAVSFAAVAPASTGLDPGNVASATRQHVARVGTIDWDGTGGAEGRFIALTDNNDGQTMTIDYTWSGTYTLNPDGTGTLDITTINTASCTPDPPPEGGACADYVDAETFSISMSKKYGSVALIQRHDGGSAGAKILLTGEAIRQSRSVTPYFFTSNSLTSRWQFRFVPAMSFAALAPGDPANVIGAPRQNVMRVGYIEFNGVGTVVPGAVTAYTDNLLGQPIMMQFQWVGTYTLGSDGIGTLSLTPVVNAATACTPADASCGTFQSPETYAFVASKSRQHLMLIQTNNTRGTGAVIYQRGTAQKQ